MLRIRFHGRGGQGMKTASRIVGSAAFHAGFVVQDAPVYGAERRGAPMAAFTRIDRQAILERGAITQPDLVVVADDTLLTDPAAQPLAGCDRQSTVLLNAVSDDAALLPLGSYEGRLVVADFTALVLAHTTTLAALSTALGAAAACLVGLSREASLAGLEEELRSTDLSPWQRQTNVQLAEAAYGLMHSWAPVQERTGIEPMSLTPLVDVPFAPPSQAAPSIYAIANSPERHTGSWRQYRPVLQRERCSRCWVCFVRCPDAAITLDPENYPVVDYAVCKGCLLCVHDCPTHAFTVVKEVR
jgi:pyruvate ferredoxin oxidoreductase gamma subunit